MNLSGHYRMIGFGKCEGISSGLESYAGRNVGLNMGRNMGLTSCGLHILWAGLRLKELK